MTIVVTKSVSSSNRSTVLIIVIVLISICLLESVNETIDLPDLKFNQKLDLPWGDISVNEKRQNLWSQWQCEYYSTAEYPLTATENFDNVMERIT